MATNFRAKIGEIDYAQWHSEADCNIVILIFFKVHM